MNVQRGAKLLLVAAKTGRPWSESAKNSESADTLTHPFSSGQFLAWLFAPAPAWTFPNLLVQSYLIDCIALASFTHSHFEKVPRVPECQRVAKSFRRARTLRKFQRERLSPAPWLTPLLRAASINATISSVTRMSIGDFFVAK